MQLLTHALAGWCIGNVGALTAKERLGCVAISCAPDLDGLSRVAGLDAYMRFHHVLAHNLLFGILASAATKRFSRSGYRVFCLYLLLFHVHLIMDLFGSGPGWGVTYLWPLSRSQLETPLAWGFLAWPNYAVLGALASWTTWIAVRLRRTPLELVAPRLDSLLIERPLNGT